MISSRPVVSAFAKKWSNSTRLRTYFSATSLRKEPARKTSFNFDHYDCIGFDLDNTLARYKIGNMLEMEYKIVANYLIKQKNYPDELLSKPIDPNFFIKGLIVDDHNGNLIRIASDGTILQAMHGTKLLSDEELLEYYPNRHWEATDMFVKDPLQTWNGPVSDVMRTLLDYFDIVVSLAFARAVDTVDKHQGAQKAYDIWPTLFDALMYMFNRSHFEDNMGEYFPEMKRHPQRYYHKCSDNVRNWLRDLNSRNKKLFLITGAHADFANHTASNTIGPDWREFFDIVVSYAKKPGFFTQRRDFVALDGRFKELGTVRTEDLRRGGMYTYGNWNGLREFLSMLSDKSNPKFLYVGDNLIQDIYVPHVHTECDTVNVCEEIEAESTLGFVDRSHPDKRFLSSTIWGSYFYCKDSEKTSVWYDLMKRHSLMCVPSVEYVAKHPVDYRFESLG